MRLKENGFKYFVLVVCSDKILTMVDNIAVLYIVTIETHCFKCKTWN